MAFGTILCWSSKLIKVVPLFSGWKGWFMTNTYSNFIYHFVKIYGDQVHLYTICFNEVHIFTKEKFNFPASKNSKEIFVKKFVILWLSLLLFDASLILKNCKVKTFAVLQQLSLMKVDIKLCQIRQKAITNINRQLVLLEYSGTLKL